MKPLENRHEQYNPDIQQLRDRFRFGMLSELQSLSQWVVWRAEIEDGKQKKVPYNPNYYQIHARASVKIPKSWGTLNQALTALESGEYSGIGFVITPPLVMIDLDHSFDRATQTITDPRAAETVQTLHSYTEASPGNGLHILAYGNLPGKGIHAAIEMYGQDRFTTITTDHIAGTPLTIEHRTEAVEALYHRFAPPVEETSIQNTRGGVGVSAGNALTALPEEAVSDPLLQQLLRGDISGFQSPSNADFVLVLKLLHWTGDNVALTRKLFLESGLYREGKTERRTGATTYIDMTIQNAIKKRRNPPQRR